MLDNLHTQKLTDILKIDEGFRKKRYKCTNEVLSIGYGFSERADFTEFHKELLKVDSFYEITEIQEIKAHLILEFTVVEIDTHMSIHHNWYNKLTQVQKMVIINMIYNLGFKGFFKFKRMIKALKSGNAFEATKELWDSNYSEQVKGRAIRLGMMLIADDADIEKKVCDDIYKVLTKRLER